MTGPQRSESELVVARSADAAARTASETHVPPLADAITDVLLLVGTDGIVRDSNERARVIMGRDPVGLRLVDLFGVWAVSELGSIVTDPPAQPEEVEAPLFGAEGEAIGYLWLVTSCGPDLVAMSGREMTYVYPLDLLRRLSARVNELREANRAMQEIIDMVAHEFKTPLTIIKGYAWLLAESGSHLPADHAAEALLRIHQGADRLLELFDEVFTVSQIEAGKLNLHPAEFDLARLVADVCHTLEAAFNGRTIELQVPEQATLTQDPSKAIQVITNLVTNALKYSEAGAAVRVKVAQARGRWQVRVFNKHEGLSAEEVGRLFQRLSRLERDSGREGRGLGLYIARNLARKLGGDIRVESKAGVGVTFIFDIPEWVNVETVSP